MSDPSRSRKKSMSTKMPKSSTTLARPARNCWAMWFAQVARPDSAADAAEMAVPPVARRTQAISSGYSFGSVSRQNRSKAAGSRCGRRNSAAPVACWAMIVA
jgi:hypothetical protein